MQPPGRAAGDGGNDSAARASQSLDVSLVLAANTAGTGDTAAIATSVGGMTMASWGRKGPLTTVEVPRIAVKRGRLMLLVLAQEQAAEIIC